MMQFRLIKPCSAFKLLLIFNSILLLNFSATSQIFAPEGVNITGSFIGFQNPPVDHLAFGNENQLPGGKIKLITTGIRRWQTTFSCADTALFPTADVQQGDYTFLFTSGPTGNPFGNKWAGANVIMNTLQNYTYNTGADNTISLVNNSYYTVNFEDAGYTNNRSIFMVTSAAPVTIDSVIQLPAGGLIQANIPVVITGLLSAAPSAEERFYLRYSADAFATSAILQMSVVNDSIIGTIPGLTNGNTIQYYIFSTTLPTAPSELHDLFTINFKNNNGLNFIYNVVGGGNLSVDLGLDKQLCAGSSVTLAAEQTYETYLWNTGAVTPSINVNQAGQYILTVTQGNQTAQDTVDVYLGEVPVFSLGNDTIICGVGTLALQPNVGLFFNGDSLTIRYDATKGLGDLENAAKVYIHSGIAASANGPWTYVAGNWGQDDGWGEMTEISPDVWEITINPTSHYNLPPAITYAGIWMVFRNADGTSVGKDETGQDIYLNTSVTPAFTSTFDGIEASYVQGPYQSIIWSTNATSISINVTNSGTYSATISNGSCIATDSITVNFLPAPTLTVSNDTSFCGAIQNLPISASSGFDTYLWSNGATTANILVNAAGVYEVTASMNNGCNFTDSVEVRNNVLASSVALGPDRTICGTQVVEIGPSVSVTSAGDSITIVYDATLGVGDLEGANTVYLHSTYELVPFGGPVTPWVGNWGIDDGLGEMTALGDDKWSITINPYSYYSIPLGTSLNGLFMVFRNANGTLTGKDDSNNDIFLNLSVNPPTSAFSGVTATADISLFNGILWSTGDTTQTIAVNSPGTYSMIVFGTEGCNVLDTIVVNSSPSPFVNLGPNRFICPGTPSITLNAGGGFSSYSWSNGDTTQLLNVSQAGVYTISVTNVAGCVGTDQLTVSAPGAATSQFTALEGNGLQVTFTNTSTGTDTYAWDYDGNGTTDNSSANATTTFTYPSVGNYTARLIAIGLCGTDTFTLQISVVGVSTGEEITESSWMVFPNPASTILNFSLPQLSTGVSNIEVYNELGALVTVISTSDKNYAFDVSNFTSGIYFVRLTNGNSVYNKRFIKQ